MWKRIIQLLKLLLILILGAILAVLLQTWSHKTVGEGIASRAVKFERIIPNAEHKVLFAGDSTAFGTGVSDPKFSTAGRFASEYPDWSVYNISENGLEMAELAGKINALNETFDLIVMQIGANDVLSIYSFPHIETDAHNVVVSAKQKSPHVIWLAGGNIGATKFFPWPVSNFFDYWSTQARYIFMKTARKEGVYLVDLYTERGDKSFYPEGQDVFARDGLHLNDAGYGIWYEKIRGVIEEKGIIKEEILLR